MPYTKHVLRLRGFTEAYYGGPGQVTLVMPDAGYHAPETALEMPWSSHVNTRGLEPVVSHVLFPGGVSACSILPKLDVECLPTKTTHFTWRNDRGGDEHHLSQTASTVSPPPICMPTRLVGCLFAHTYPQAGLCVTGTLPIRVCT